MIKFSIRTKLFIAILLACSVAVTAALGFFRFQFERTYLEFVRQQENQHLQQLKDTLLTYYATAGTWETLRSDRRHWFRLQRPPRPAAEENDAPPPIAMSLPVAQTIYDVRRRTVLLDENYLLIQGLELPGKPDIEHTLTYQGKVIGYLGLYQRTGFSESSDDAKFLAQQNKTLLIIALSTLLGSMLVALLFSRQLVKPIQSLRNSTSELADGNYAVRIAEVSGDELGQLSHDFNQLAARLQQTEQARRQWILDIAHELRTPLSILRGEIEAIQDGINAADTQTIYSLHQETLHLQRLVEDLYALSMSDSGALSYHKTELDIIQVLRETITQFESRFRDQGLTLDTRHISHSAIPVQGDNQRLQQLFQNLLKNSLRYTDAPGTLSISTHMQKGRVEINFADSAPAVPEESLPRLFERLYRVDSSRNRATGGAGIGLSLCHNIMEAHGGTISAAHSDLGGLQITLRLPTKTAQPLPLKTSLKKTKRG